MLATACATTEYIEVRPQVEIEPRPVIDVDWFDLCAAIHSEQACSDPAEHDTAHFERVRDSIDDLITWGLVNEAALRECCKAEE